MKAIYSKPETVVINIETEGVMAQSRSFTVSETEHGGGISRARKGFWEGE